MAYTVDDFLRDAPREILSMLSMFSAEERRAFLELMPAEERLRGLPPEERLRGLPPEERLRGLSDEERERLRRLLDQPH